MHQIKIDALADQGVAGAEVVLDGVERADDVGQDPGLLLNLPKCCLFRGFALGDGPLRQPPAGAVPGGDHGYVRAAVERMDHRPPGGVLVARLPPVLGHIGAIVAAG